MATPDTVPPGFSPFYIGLRELLLPSALVRQLRQRDLELVREQRLEEDASSNSETDADTEQDTGAEHPDADDSYQVYSDSEVSALTQRVDVLKDVENKTRIRKIVKELVSRGNRRAIVKPETLEGVQALAEKHPNFADAIALVHRRLVLAAAAGNPARIQPILLCGEPGVGKTHVAGELAKVLRAPMRRVSFDAGAENSALLGLDKQWGNTQHGALFELICLGQAANPTVILEEIDKTHNYSDSCPLDALHTLLEPSTSVAVRDLSIEFTFDASLATYVATANDVLKVPESLRSRFEIFHIRFPDAQQAIQIALQVASATLAELAPNGFASADRAVAVALAHLTPREIRRAVMDGIATALINGRCGLRVTDLPAELISGGRVSTIWLH